MNVTRALEEVEAAGGEWFGSSLLSLILVDILMVTLCEKFSDDTPSSPKINFDSIVRITI